MIWVNTVNLIFIEFEYFFKIKNSSFFILFCYVLVVEWSQLYQVLALGKVVRRFLWCLRKQLNLATSLRNISCTRWRHISHENHNYVWELYETWRHFVDEIHLRIRAMVNSFTTIIIYEQSHRLYVEPHARNLKVLLSCTCTTSCIQLVYCMYSSQKQHKTQFTKSHRKTNLKTQKNTRKDS